MPLIEITTFRLGAHATEAEFLDADRRVQTEFAYHQPGLLRRTTARDRDKGWVVITQWRDAADAEAAAARARHDPAIGDLDTLLEAGSVTTRAYETLD
jgi:hypothetical protein